MAIRAAGPLARIHRRIAASTALAMFAGPALAQQTSGQDDESSQDDGSYRTYLQAGLGYFSGEYGLPEETVVEVLSFSARRYLRRGELRISVPYLHIEGPADIQFIGGQAVGIPGELVVGSERRESGLGDITLRGDYYLRRGTDSTPWVIGSLRVKAPTGDEEKGLGTGTTDVEVGVSLIQRVGPVNWLADLGYKFVGESTRFDFEDVTRILGGLSVPFGPGERRSFYTYVENRTNIVRDREDRRSLIVGLDTALDQSARLRLTASAFVGLTDATEDYGVYVTIGRRY